MVAPRNLGVGFDVRARTRQSKFQMDALTLDDDSLPLKSQSAFGQVEEDTSVFWTELGVVKHSTAPSRTRSALSFRNSSAMLGTENTRGLQRVWTDYQ